MATATVASKGQITLPKIVRERLGVGAGDKVEFVETAPGNFRVIADKRRSVLAQTLRYPPAVVSGGQLVR